MSDMSQGPGWWQASDGKWYAPEKHPNYQAPTAPQPTATAAAPPPQAMAPPPQMAVGAPQQTYVAAPPPTKSSNKGCMILLIVFFAFIVVAIIGSIVAITYLGKKVDDGSVFGKTTCDTLSNADASAILGGSYDGIQLGGLTNIAAPALDSRVLADGKTCWFSPTGSAGGSTVRVATSSGGSAKFDAEKKQAQGTKQDKGNGLSVESAGYFLKDGNTGDESFCTSTDFTGMSGALVRKGDNLIYVSVGLDSSASSTTLNFDTVPGKDGLPGGFTIGDANKNCEVAQKIADKVKS